MISIKDGDNVIHYFSHLIRANESWITSRIEGTKKLEVPLAVVDFSYLATS